MKKLFSIFFCLLLLASNTHITYAQHFCGDMEMMAKLTLGEATLSCGMVDPADSCDHKDLHKHSCCDNHYTQIHTDDTFQLVSTELPTPIYYLVTAPYVLQPELKPEGTLKVPIPSSYVPPPLFRDHQVLYETFLI